MNKIMKLIFVGLLASNFSIAQMHISTNLREDYNWSSYNNNWQLSSDDQTSATLFDFNKDMTMFRHTTATISSTYYIKGKSFDKDKNITEYEIVSDVGNKYKLIMDLDNDNLRFIGTMKDGTPFLVRHSIKRVWYDE